MEHCKVLQEYSRFVAKIRNYLNTGPGPLSEKELSDLLNECAKEGILVDFLKTHGTEVISMLFTEMTGLTAEEINNL